LHAAIPEKAKMDFNMRLQQPVLEAGMFHHATCRTFSPYPLFLVTHAPKRNPSNTTQAIV
jgi:hypothetical protein